MVFTETYNESENFDEVQSLIVPHNKDNYPDSVVVFDIQGNQYIEGTDYTITNDSVDQFTITFLGDPKSGNWYAEWTFLEMIEGDNKFHIRVRFEDPDWVVKAELHE